MRLHVLFGLGCLLGSLVSCATGSKFQGSGGSSSDGGGGGDAGNGGATTTTTAATGGTGGGATTTSSGTTTMETCDESPCQLVAPQCGCTGGDMCAINGTGEKECHAPGDKQIDQQCTGLYSCAPGSLCTQVSTATSLCTAYCDSDAQCAGGLCLIQLNDPQNPGQVLPGVTLCSDDCDPVTGTGCPAGFGLGCHLGQEPDGTMKVFTICGGSGSGTQGTTCTDSEDCAPGLACFTVGAEKTCLQYCKPPNGVCPGGATCLSFETPLLYKGVEYGACL